MLSIISSQLLSIRVMNIAGVILRLLSLGAVVVSVCQIVFLYLFKEPAYSLLSNWSIICAFMVWHWIYFDAVNQRYHRSFSFGLNIQLYGWLLVPSYLLVTRGKKAIYLMFWLMFCLFGPSVIVDIFNLQSLN